MAGSKLNKVQRTNRLFYIFALISILIIPFLLQLKPAAISACSFKSIFGLPCPTCGITRSFVALASLNLPQAFTYNLMGPLLFLLIVCLILINMYELLFNHKSGNLTGRRSGNYLFISFFLIWLIYWIFRMIYNF